MTGALATAIPPSHGGRIPKPCPRLRRARTRRMQHHPVGAAQGEQVVQVLGGGGHLAVLFASPPPPPAVTYSTNTVLYLPRSSARIFIAEPSRQRHLGGPRGQPV